MSKPLLTIGIIFKNDIRCIERCLKALQPLRDAAPCELVMADTGSADGSREVAEQYADILFNFPWINDFAAARNAVMDRASGKWFFTVDTDEYLDTDLSEMKQFLRQEERWEMAAVVQRNYKNDGMDEIYTDFMAQRLVKLSTGSRYQGMIHEALVTPDRKMPNGIFLPHTILHHDGYVGLNDERGAEKRQRNLVLLREELSMEPDNLLVWLQLIESGYREEDIWENLHRAAELVGQRKPMWERAGPPILRYAATRAEVEGRSDAEEWIKKAEGLFPDSFFTRLDVQCSALTIYMKSEDYTSAINAGERYLQAMEEYREGKAAGALCTSSLQCTVKPVEQGARVALATAYEKEKQPERALRMLEGIDFSKHFDAVQILRATTVLMNIHSKSELDTRAVLLALWEGVINPDQPEGQANMRRGSFFQAAGSAFTRQNREAEIQWNIFSRCAYTLFLPLENKCELGRAAVILESNDPETITETLSMVEDWTEFPAPALAHALACGVNFPLVNDPLNLEEIDDLAGRLAEDEERIITLILEVSGEDFTESRQKLTWARGLVMAAVQSIDWKAVELDVEQGMSVARVFAQVERQFLPCCYTPDTLKKKGLFVLPPLHRFGWFCAQAFEQLDTRNPVSYVHLLREGLNACPAMKYMVEFLTDHTPELHKSEPSDELRALAEQIRAVLARFSPDDPAVAALKQSEAYQKVAYLIEGAEVPVVGGLKQ